MKSARTIRSLELDSGPESRHGNAAVAVIAVILILVSLAAYFGPELLDRIKAGPEKSDSAVITHTVRRESLLVTVTEDGELQSASNVDVKCEIPGGSTILWIIPDGTVVQKDQEIVRLDSSGIEEQLTQQTGVYEKALAAQIKSKEDAEAASIAVEEYVKGTFVKDLQEVESLITIAEENLRSARNLLQHTERMARKGFATPLQVEADGFAVKRAQLDLDFAKTSKDVLEKFTRQKTTRELQATRDAALALARSEQATVELEKGKLDRLKGQLEKCVINAPQAGMVVYYAERHRFGSSNSQIEEGAPVRERQTIIQLPDLTQIQARVPVHESRVEEVHAGQRAHLKVLDKEFQGVVTSIANQPESKSFFAAKVKEYPAEVRVEGDCSGIRPGMTAEVEILIADLEDVLTIPVSAVVVRRNKFYGFVQTPGGPEKRELLLGMSNNEFVEVKDGVSEGEDVLMNPRAVMSEELTGEDEEAEEETTDTRSRFGEASPAEGPSSSEAGQAPSGGPDANAARTGKPTRRPDSSGRSQEGRPASGGAKSQDGRPRQRPGQQAKG